MFSVQIEKYMMHTQSALFEIIQVKHDIIKFLGKTKYVYKQDKCKFLEKCFSTIKRKRFKVDITASYCYCTAW